MPVCSWVEFAARLAPVRLHNGRAAGNLGEVVPNGTRVPLETGNRCEGRASPI